MTNGQVIPAASIPNLVFSPALNANGTGYASFTFSVRDTGGPAFDAVPNTITFNVTAVNDRPVIDLDGDDDRRHQQRRRLHRGPGQPNDLGPECQVNDVDNSEPHLGPGQDHKHPRWQSESLAASGCVAAITVTPYNSASGVLALSGSASLADYEACLRLVTYNNTDQDPSSADRLITWTITDGDLVNSPLAVTTLSVTPVNDAPVVAPDGCDSANEGDIKTYTYTVTDVDSALSTVTETCGANGDRTDTATANHFTCTFPDGPANSLVKVTADDGDATNNIGSDEIDVTIANADPIANAGADKTGTEGSSVSFTFNCTDPGVNDTWSASVDWGDGSADTTFASVTCNTATTFNASHTYADDDGSPFTVTLTVNDDDGGTDTDTASVTIANADPIANAGADKTGTEGSSVSFTFNCTDPGVNDTWSASVDWGDGSADTTFASVTCNTATTFNASHTYADDDGSPFTVTLTVNDDDGGTDTDTASVTIANADPIANAGADKTGTEGSSVSFTFNCTDPGVNDTWSASVDWGDGSTDTTFASVTCNTATTFNASHTYADDDGSPFTVTLTVNDDDGGTDTDTASVASPTPTRSPMPAPTRPAPRAAASASPSTAPTPASNDTWSASVDWGDGSTDTTFASVTCNTATTFNASHTYADDDGSPFTVTLTVNDDDAGTDTTPPA